MVGFGCIWVYYWVLIRLTIVWAIRHHLIHLTTIIIIISILNQLNILIAQDRFHPPKVSYWLADFKSQWEVWNPNETGLSQPLQWFRSIWIFWCCIRWISNLWSHAMVLIIGGQDLSRSKKLPRLSANNDDVITDRWMRWYWSCWWQLIGWQPILVYHEAHLPIHYSGK